MIIKGEKNDNNVTTKIRGLKTNNKKIKKNWKITANKQSVWLSVKVLIHINDTPLKGKTSVIVVRFFVVVLLVFSSNCFPLIFTHTGEEKIIIIIKRTVTAVVSSVDTSTLKFSGKGKTIQRNCAENIEQYKRREAKKKENK